MSQLSPAIQAVLELFQGPLADLRFADVDAAVLAHSAGAVEAAASTVAEQEAQLTELRQTLADRQDALLVLVQRALAYARVYAEHDEALTEQLSRITLARASKPRKASTKAAGSEAAGGANPSAAHELATTQSDAEADATLIVDAATDPNTEAAASDAPDNDTPPQRKGKRRVSIPRDDTHSRPA